MNCDAWTLREPRRSGPSFLTPPQIFPAIPWLNPPFPHPNPWRITRKHFPWEDFWEKSRRWPEEYRKIPYRRVNRPRRCRPAPPCLATAKWPISSRFHRGTLSGTGIRSPRCRHCRSGACCGPVRRPRSMRLSLRSRIGAASRWRCVPCSDRRWWIMRRTRRRRRPRGPHRCRRWLWSRWPRCRVHRSSEWIPARSVKCRAGVWLTRCRHGSRWRRRSAGGSGCCRGRVISWTEGSMRWSMPPNFLCFWINLFLSSLFLSSLFLSSLFLCRMINLVSQFLKVSDHCGIACFFHAWQYPFFSVFVCVDFPYRNRRYDGV